MRKRPLALSLVAVVIIIVVVVIALLLTHKTASLSSSQTSVDKQQIETSWKNFFAASTSLKDREQLLQNGSQFNQFIESEFAALGSQKSSTVINGVDVTSSTSANVTYTVMLDGQAVLTGQKGTAILVNNTWQVSDSTFCGLLSMAGSKPAACQKY